MATTNQGINLPITAQLTNLKQIATQLKQFSDINILGNSFSSKTINSELSKVMRALEALELRSKNAFKTEADFSAVEKEANKIENSLDNVKKTITSIPFKDLKIPEDAAKQIQELETKINGLNAGFKDFKKLQKEGLVGNTQFTTDLAKAFGTNAASKMLDKEYDELYKSIKNGLTRVNNELEIQKNIFTQNSQIVQQNTTGKADQSVLNALDWLSKGFATLPKNPDKYNEQQQMLSKYFNFNEDKTAFTSFKRGNFSDNFYKELAEKFQIDPTQMEEIRKRVRESAQAIKKTVSQELQDIVSNKDKGAQIFSGRNIDYTGLVASAAEYRSQIKTRDTSGAAVDNTTAKLNAAQAAYNAFMQTQDLVNQKQTELANALKEPVSSLESLKQAIYNNVQAAPQLGAAYDEAAARLNQLRATADAGKAKLQQLDSAMGKLTGFSNFVNRYIGLYAIMRKVTQAIRNAFNNIKELDKTITNIAVVTNMTQADLWSKIGEYTSMAQQFGVATNDVYTVSQIFYQQGLQTAQVMSLTTETLKMAKIAGLEYGEAADAMTVAVRAFKIEMTEAQQVTDTYSALAAKFAVSSAEIANAMEKTASSAANVGMSIQSTSAFISVMVQTTRESAENIGSALKSIISRYGEMKASPSKLLNIDGEEVAFNKVDTALASVGISIKDAAGQFRNFDDVIMELAQKWDTLDNNTQRYIATIMAGNRQQSRFIALVSNYEELSRAISTANNAENASIVQVAKTMDSLETKAQQVKNAFSQIYLDLHIENGLKDMYDWLTRVLKTIGKLGMKNGALPTLANLIGFGTGTKSLINMAKNKINEYKSKINLNTEEAEQKYKDLEQKLREPIDKKLNLIVDDTQIKTVQANIQSAATTAGTSAASALVNATPNAGHNTQFYLAAMARWQSEGKLQTPEQRASFMNQYGIDSSSEQGQQINALLEQFSTLTGQAQQLGTALIDASNASNNATRADDEEARSSQQAVQNDEQETASSKQVTLADVSKARAAEEAARALAALARIDAQEAADKAQRASNNAASNREELQEAANVAKAKAEEAAEAVKVAQADREKTSAAFQAQQADTNKAQEGNNVIQTEKAKESANIVVTQTEYDESNANKDSAQSERDKANANRTSNNIRGGSWEGHQTAMKVTGVLTGLSRMAGTALAAWGASQTVKSTDVNESNKILTGIGNGISGAGTGASMGMAFGPWGAAIGAIGGFLLGGLGAIIDGANYTLAERIENAKQEAEAANNEALKQQAKVTDLSSQIDNIEQLRKSMYNSTEDMKAYKDAMNNMAAEYPYLISSYDEAGNAIIEINNAEQELSRIRLNGVKAARNAALAEANKNKLELKAAQSALDTMETPIISSTENYSSWAQSKEYTGMEVAGVVIPATYELSSGFGGHYYYNYEEALKAGAQALYGTTLDKIDYNQLLNIIDAYQKDYDFTGAKTKFNLEDHTQGYIADWQWRDYRKYVEEASPVNFDTYSLASLNDIILKYSSLFGGASSVWDWQKIEENSAVSLEQFNQIKEQVQQILLQTQQAFENSIQLYDQYLAQDVLITTANSSSMPSSILTELGNNKIYSQLFTRMLNSQNSNYTDLYSWQQDKNSNFLEISSELSKNFIQWYELLTSAQRKILESLDFTQYRSVDEILQELGINPEKLKNDNQKLYESFSQQFVESNQSNANRIMKTIWATDENGQFINEQREFSISPYADLNGEEKEQIWNANQINEDLGGLISLGQEQEQQKIHRIVDRFDYEDSTINTDINSMYSEFFTTQLLSINDLAKDGYDLLAKARLEALYKIAIQLGNLDSQTQSELFGIVSNIDFTNYDSIVNAEKAIKEYANNNELDLNAEENSSLEGILDTLVESENNLIFNVNTLAQSITEKINEAAKEIDPILNTNKSGLNLSSALEQFNKINANFDEINSFDQVFTYNAALGKYIYTIDGVRAALKLQEGQLTTYSNQLASTVEKYGKSWRVSSYEDGDFGLEEILSEEELPYRPVSKDIDLTQDNTQILQQLGINKNDEGYLLYNNLITEYLKNTAETDRNIDGLVEFFNEKIKQAVTDQNLANQQLEAFYQNYSNQLYQSIDWVSLSLNTDFTGANDASLQLLAQQLGKVEVIETKNDGEEVWAKYTGSWKELYDDYFEQLQGSNDEIKAVARGQLAQGVSQQISTAITELLNGSEQILSEATIGLIKATDNLEVVYDENGIAIAGEDFVNTAIEFYNKHANQLISLSERNQVWSSILNKQFEAANQVVSTLSSGASLDVEGLEKIFTTINLELATYFDGSTWKEGFENIFKTDMFGKTTITDWTGFNAILAKQLGPEQILQMVGTFEYQNAYSSYVDGMIQLDTQMNELIKKSYDNAFSSITEWKPVNVAQLEQYAPGYINYLNKVGVATIENGKLVVENAAEFARSISTLMIGLSSLSSKDLYNQIGWTTADLAKNWKNAQTVITAVQDSWTGISENLAGLTTDNISALVEKGNLKLTNVTDIFDKFGDVYVLSLTKYREQLEIAFGKTEKTPLTSYQQKQINDAVGKAQAAIVNKITGLNWEQVLGGTATEFETTTFVDELIKSLKSLGLTLDEILANNGSIDVQNLRSVLQTKIKEGTVDKEVGDAILNNISNTIATVRDTALEEISGGFNLMTEGTTNQVEIQKFVQRYNKILQAGQQIGTVDSLFEYDSILQTWALTTEALKTYAENQKIVLRNMGMSEEAITQFINNQTQQLITSQMDITGYLNSNTLRTDSKEALTLVKQIQQWYAFESEEIWKSFGEQATEIFHITQNGKEKPIEQYSDKNKQDIITSYVMRILSMGGEEAVRMLEELKGSENISSDEIQAVYRTQINRLQTAAEQLAEITVGSLITGDLIPLLQNTSNFEITDLGNGTAVVEAVGDMVEAYARLYYQMKNSAEATTQELNSAYAQMLTARDQSRIDAISALNDAMGMSYEDLGNLIGKYGKDEWSNLEYMMQHSLTAGIESLGNGQVRIRDFEAFSRQMNWQVNGEAYLEAYSSYRDALIELETKTSTNITNEIKSLTEARPGDKINLTYLSRTLSGATRAFLEKHGAIITNSILELDQKADIPAITQKLIEEAARSGEVISSDLAELAEAINSYLQNLANLIKSGITGSLKATEAQQLQEWAVTKGITDLNFIQTREGLKLSQQSAIELYNTLKDVDALQASLVFDELNNSLKETNEHYNSITDILSRIAWIEDKKHPERANQYKEELALAKEILAVRSTAEDDSFNFMSNKIPGGQNNPLNYANNWMKAFTTIRDSFNTKSKGDQAGFIDYQDWYNIANEINNLAALSGPIEIGALKFDGSLESASAAIQAGCNALTAVDSGEMKVNLMDVGINIQSGADLMGKGIDEGIDQVAKSQIKMLDGLIAMMELIVQMEQLGDLDTEGNGIDLSDLFAVKIDPNTGEEITDWEHLNQKYLDWIEEIKSTMKTNEDLQNAVDNIKIGEYSLAEIFKFGPENFTGENESFGQAYAAVLEAFRQAALSGNYDLDNIYASIESVLKESGLTEDITLDIGDTTLIISGGVMTTIDWSAPDKKEIRDQYVAAHEGTAEQAQKALTSIQNKYAKGEALGSDLEWALRLNGKLIIESDGTYVINGKSYKDADEAEEAMYTEALKDAGFDGKTITVKDGNVSTTYELKGHQITVKYDENGIHYTMEGQEGAYSSQEQMIEAAWAKEAGSMPQRYNDEAQKVAWIYSTFGIRAQVQPNITDEKGNKLNANDPTVREKIKNEISNIMSGEQLALGDDGNLHIDMGGITYTVSGEAVVEADGTTVNKDKVLAELRSALGLDTVLIDNISLGIQQAFTDLPEIKFDADTEAALAKLQELKDEASNVDFKLALNDNQVKTAIQDNITLGNSKPVKQSINVNHNYVANAIDNNVSRGAKKPVLQEIRQSGGSGSQATGNVGSAMATGTLMGELGPELVVSGGRYFVAGQNGAEFVNLAPDAIVFNHLQTEQLLKNGMSSSRGKAVTSEHNAVAYASGNVSGGPAMASAASALAALKELRAMWQSLLNASLSDLAQLAGGGGGGGGGKKKDAGFARDLERWYNLLRQIADLEKQITYQETLRKKLESDRIIDGKAYYQSQKESLKLLDAEMTRQHELIYLQEDYYKRRQEELNNSKLNTIFTFNEDGLLQLREDEAFTFGKGTKYEFTGTGFEAFSEIFKRDEHEVPKYTAEEQYNMAKAFGWGEYMQYDSSGNKIDISEDGGYANAVKAFSDKFDSTQKEFETLHDELEDTKKELLTKADERNQQLQAIIDNQVSLENRILSAIENMRQKSIDNAKDQKDAIQESAEKFIDGLSNSLDKERNMYENAENDNELQRMKRQLAILQRSGGSASQIRSLQQNIAERERDTYFQAQQDQIDAIKEASDAEIDRLEHEISIMEETLAYQKEHGLLWQDVYQVMAQTPEQIEAFLLENSKDLEGKSTLQIAEDLRTIKSEIEQWVSRRDDSEDVIAAEPEHNWDVYYPAAKNNFNLDDEADAALIAKAKQAYEERYAQTGDEVEAAAAADAVFEPYKKAKNPKYAGVASGSEVDNNTTNNSTTGITGGKINNKTSVGYVHMACVEYGTGKVLQKKDFTWTAGSTFTPSKQAPSISNYQIITTSPAIKVEAGKSYNITVVYQKKILTIKTSEPQGKSQVYSAFSSGGLANYTGLAMVHGSKQDPEAFLNAEETHMWRDKILSGNSGSLTSMLLDFQNMVSGMVNSESYSSIGTGEGINIENAVVNMNATISNDYDARRAADNVLDEMVRIARKTTAQQARR